MICAECAYEADKVKAGRRTHLEFRITNSRWRAFGADHSPMGHAACKGGTWCDCMHRDVVISEH